MTAVRLCMLGCGAVARTHSRVARSLGGIELLYASRSLEKAETYNRRFGGIGAFGSYEEACADPRVDAVIVCTPQAFHVEHATLAARHDKATLIEKPVTRTLGELAAIEAAVRRAGGLGRVCMVAENYHFKPALRVLRRHLDAGDIGQALFIELNRAGRQRPTGWRADAELMGGGALLEGGVHWVNYLCGLGGAVREVCAARPETNRPLVAPFEDGLEMLVKFESGAVGKLLHAWSVTNRLAGLGLSKIYGTEGSITFESNGLFALVTGRRTRLRFPGVRDLMGYRAMLRHFIACIRERREPEVSLAVARRELAVVLAAYRSLETRRFEPPFTED
ncbi:MAG TPA: Gfo/Idh/MocA family oxidoreductase [Gemmatimonadales bacterium]|nr:Gfo/Idh/MocA family oxidoreductase [Gemmatimonadales bacterium]